VDSRGKNLVVDGSMVESQEEIQWVGKTYLQNSKEEEEQCEKYFVAEGGVDLEEA